MCLHACAHMCSCVCLKGLFFCSGVGLEWALTFWMVLLFACVAFILASELIYSAVAPDDSFTCASTGSFVFLSLTKRGSSAAILPAFCTRNG